MKTDTKANVIALVVLLGFVVSLCIHHLQGMYWGMPYPYNTFLFVPHVRFSDYFGLLDWNRDLNPYLRDAPTSQFPLLNLISWMLTKVPVSWSFGAFLGFCLSVLLATTAAFMWHSKDRLSTCLRASIIVGLNYPLLFAIDRGNFELLLCPFLLLFAYCYKTGRTRISAFFLACTIAMKVFPVVLIVAYVAERKYKAALQTISWTLVLTLGSLAAFQGGVIKNLALLLSGGNVAGNTNVALFTGNSNYVQRGVSLFTSLKILHYQYDMHILGDASKPIGAYALWMVMLAILLVAYCVLVERVAWKRMTILVFVMLLFPQISADYKLLHVVIPLLLFAVDRSMSKLDFAYALGFALLLVPKQYAFFEHVQSEAGHDIGIGALVNPLLMVVMILTIVGTGMLRFSWKRAYVTFTRHLRALRALWPTTSRLW